MNLFEEAKKYYEENKQKLDAKVSREGIPEGEIRLRDYVVRKLKQQVELMVENSSSQETLQEEDIKMIKENLMKIMPVELFDEVIKRAFETDIETFDSFLLQNPVKERVKEQLNLVIDEAYDLKEQEEGFMTMRLIEKYVMLDSIDTHWVDHLENMEDLRSGSSLQGYGQKDPLNLYQNEGYNLFVDMMASVDSDIAKRVMFYTARAERQARKSESAARAKSAARLAQEALEQAFREAQSKKKSKFL